MKKNYLLKLANSASLKERACATIKRAIIHNQLQSGVYHSVPELAEKLGVSRSPVREALLELSYQGFIEFIPRKGLRIRELTEKDIRHLIAYRKIMERGALEGVFQRGIAAQAAGALTGHHRRLRNAFRAGDQGQFIDVDRAFHSHVAGLSENPYIIAALENVRDLVDWTNHKLMANYNRGKEVLEEHQAIIAGLARNDLPETIAAMDRHLDTALERMVTRFFDRG